MPMVGGEIGRVLGQAGGSAIGNLFGAGNLGGQIGGILGGAAGSRFIPFKKGGMVKPKRGKTQKAILHKGEMVVPASLVKHVPKSLKSKIKKKGGRNM